MVAQPGHGLQSIVQMATIGGRMPLGLAKGVDFVSGAVLAPLLMAAFNWCWFDNAQTSAFAEHESQPVSLSVAVEASCTSSGVYDFFKLQKLLKPRKGKFTVLAVLTLLSAVSKTLMSNIIAYESFTVPRGGRNVTLRLLSDKKVSNSTRRYTVKPWISTQSVYGFTLEQHLSLTRRVYNLYLDFKIRNDTVQLFPDGSYLGVNATSESLNLVDSDITRLTGVPGFKLTINCTSDFNFTPESLSMDSKDQVTRISVLDYKNDTPYRFRAFSITDPEQIMLRYNSTFLSPIHWFVGYGDRRPRNHEYSEVFLGAMIRYHPELVVNKSAISDFKAGSGTPRFPETVYGPIIPQIQDLVYRRNGKLAPSIYMGRRPQVWGLRCTVLKQDVLYELVRESHPRKTIMNAPSVSTLSGWSISNHSTRGEPYRFYPLIRRLQTIVAFKAETGDFSGFGGALAASARYCVELACGGIGGTNGTESRNVYDQWRYFNYEKYAANFLYAVGETERMVYEIAATVPKNDTDTEVVIDGVGTATYYRITYVPAILICALLCLTASGILVASLSWWTRKSWVSARHRKVDATRIVLDAVAGLQGEELITEAANIWKTSEVAKWADGYNVRYIELQDDDGSISVVLKPAVMSE